MSGDSHGLALNNTVDSPYYYPNHHHDNRIPPASPLVLRHQTR